MKVLLKSLLLVSIVAVLAVPVWAQTETGTTGAGTTMAPTGMEKKMSKGSEWVKSVQEALAAKGNDPGPADGKLGPKTKTAIKEFQKANGLKETGKVDKETAEKLGVQMPAMTHHKMGKTEKTPQTKP